MTGTTNELKQTRWCFSYSFTQNIFDIDTLSTYVKVVFVSMEIKNTSILSYVNNQFFKKNPMKVKGRTALTFTSITFTNNGATLVLQLHLKINLFEMPIKGRYTHK